MSSRDPLVLMRDMLDMANDGVEIARGHGRADLDRNRMLRHALVRCIEVVGEAANRIPATDRAGYP